MKEFNWPVRIYYDDTDAGGVVYHANYLKYLEQARTEWLRKLGFSQERLRKEQCVIFGVKNAKIDYIAPARHDQLLDVSSRLERVGGASMLFAHRISCLDQTLCDAVVNIVCLDAVTLKPKRIPLSIRTELKS